MSALPTLQAGRTLVLRKQGLLIQANAEGPIDGLFRFSVHFTGEQQSCERGIPRIEPGLFGEYRNCGPSDNCSTPEGFIRTSSHEVQYLKNNDSNECGDSTFTVTLASTLTPGWAFDSTLSSPVDPDDTARPLPTFGFGNVDGAVDGDYDFCIAVVNQVSGLRSAKVHRLTVPFSDEDPWYILTTALLGTPTQDSWKNSLLEGCDPSFPDCVWNPPSTCNLSLECNESPLSAFGRCWEEDGVGAEYHGRDNCAIEQRFASGGLPCLRNNLAWIPCPSSVEIRIPAILKRRHARALVLKVVSFLWLDVTSQAIKIAATTKEQRIRSSKKNDKS